MLSTQVFDIELIEVIQKKIERSKLTSLGEFIPEDK